MSNGIHPEEGKQPIQMDEAIKVILRSDAVPTEIDVRGRKYFPKEYKGEGVKGVVWKGTDEYGGDVAIKFTIHEDYIAKSYLDEARRARDLGGSCFARFIDSGISEIQLSNDGIRKFIIFVEQWVNGSTLPQYIEVHGATPAFFLNYARGMCNALGILAAKGYRHDDLKPDNVMIEDPEEGAISRETKVKVIDTGSMKSLTSPKRKPRPDQPWFREDDYRWFAEHLLLIRNVLYSRKPLSLNVARFIKEIDPLLDRMFEEDRGVALWAPGRVCTEFESAWTRAQAPVERSAKLNNPFDYIAAEHIVSDELLVKLYADSCPWFAEISSPNPVLLTGPRGCGKSMAFRRMSLRVLLHKSSDEIRASQIAGFYISCSGDLRNRLGWLSDMAAKKFRNEVLHYFNLLLAREIAQTLATISIRDDRQSLFGFGIAEEQSIHECFMEQMQISEPEQRRLQGMSRMEHALSLIEQKMDECYRTMRMGMSVSHVTDESFLASITRLMHKNISYIRDRKVVFLIDDFSVHRLPGAIQSILNLVLWDRQGTYVSKVSAEKYGAVGIDEIKATSEVGRELREFDCGRFYLDANIAATRLFAKDLLRIRLHLSEYKGTPDQLIGASEYQKKGGLGQALRDKLEHPGRKNDQYHGMQTIADLCSGDISNLLEVYRRIFEEGKVKNFTTERVPAHIQHKAIQSVSRDLFELIKNYVPKGPDMYNLVQSFGNLSRRILQEGPLMKHGPDLIPQQTTRIEVEPSAPGQPIDELAADQQELMDELVRRTIFIEMEPGRSRHQFTPTLRWQLRKIYCPTFSTSINKNTAVKWRPDEFKRFLLSPKTSCEEEIKRLSRPSSPQQSLFTWIRKKTTEKMLL